MHHFVNMLHDLHFNAQYTFYSCLFAGLFAYLGLGLALLFTPQSLRRYSLFLSPLIGFCYLTLIGWYCYISDMHGTDAYAGYLLLPPLLFLYLGYRRSRQRRETASDNLWNRSHVAPVLVAVLGFLVVSIPYFRDVHGLTSITIGNNDIADSASVSTYLKEFARSDTGGFLGQSGIFRRLADRSIFGATYSTAFCSSLFGKESYQLQSLSVNVFFFLCILMVYPLARDSFQYDHYGGLVVTTLFAMSPVLAFTVYNGYQGEIFAAALAVALVLFHLRLIRGAERLSDCYEYVPLVILLDWGISLTYPNMLPFVYAPLGMFALFLWIHSKKSRRFVTWLSFTVATLGVMALLSPYRAGRVVLQTITTGHETAGWFIPWYFSVFGVKNGNPYFHAALSCVLGLVIIISLWKEYNRNRTLFLLSTAFLLTLLSGFAMLCFMGRSDTLGWGGYKSYKLFSFFLPLILAGSLTVSRNIGGMRLYRILCIACLTVTIVGSGYLMREMVWSVETVGRQLVKLTTVEGDSRVQSVNILGTNEWNILWETDFLLDKRLYFQTSTYAGRRASPLDGAWDLEPTNAKGDAKRSSIGGCMVPVDASYVLIKATKKCRTME